MPYKSEPTTPRLFAHRGSTLLAPENTIAAFDLAIDYQCDVLETDVRLSKDNVVMVTHDESLDRTTNGSGLVREHACSALKKLDAGCRFADMKNQPYDGPKQSLLTLTELFEHYPSIGINIDIKDNDMQAAIAVAKVIEQNQQSSAQWVNVGSFHAPVIQHFRKIAPSVSTAATRQEVAQLVFGLTKRSAPPYQLLQIPEQYWGIQLTGKRLINKAHARGCEIMYWTINDSNKMKSLLNKQANGIVTDRPDLALEVFQALGLKASV